jgi:hypothetical protein
MKTCKSTLSKNNKVDNIKSFFKGGVVKSLSEVATNSAKSSSNPLPGSVKSFLFISSYLKMIVFSKYSDASAFISSFLSLSSRFLR